MTWTDKTYVIVPIGDITQAMVDQCLQDTVASLRLNLAETHGILKWYTRDEVDPTLITALDPAPTQYTNVEILAFIGNFENGWIEEEE